MFKMLGGGLLRNYLILAGIIAALAAALLGFTYLIGGTWRTLFLACLIWTFGLAVVSLILSFGNWPAFVMTFTTYGFFMSLPAVVVVTAICKWFGIR